MMRKTGLFIFLLNESA